MSSVDDAVPETSTPRRAWVAAAVQWRNWPLLVKLGVVLVVPVVSALVLGVLRVNADVALADSYTGIERIASVRVELVHVLAAVQRERDEALRGGAELRQAGEETGRAVTRLTDVVRETPELATSGYRALVRALDTLPLARGQVAVRSDGIVVLSAYNSVTNTVLEFDRALIGRFPDETLTSTSIALGELMSALELVSTQQAIGNLVLSGDALAESEQLLLLEADVRLEDRLDDFRSLAPRELVAHYDATVTGQDVSAFQQLVIAARATGLVASGITPERWNTAANGRLGRMSEVTEDAANGLRAESAALAESISDRAGLESVLLLLMVLLAGGIGGGLGRYLLRSVALLRRTALDVARHRLPAVVESIRAGEGVSAAGAIEPVPLHTTEEFGQLARAFDAVHGQAVRSAAEEASLRGNLANIFTNLSRRSQGLVERQLRLMEQLERKTDDPDQLEDLFRIDHLATRMRRNNENLMVLSGTGLLRRFTEPMSMPDVLRAAISEVEHYQRAVVQTPSDIRIAGYAAGDLIRSVSELIENATAFSPPAAQVTVASRVMDDGTVLIEVLDNGVGMTEADLAQVNLRVAGGGGVDVPISRQMGLFVVGRLTARHGIEVRLSTRPEGGLCASVLVPANLVTHTGPPPADAPTLVSMFPVTVDATTEPDPSAPASPPVAGDQVPTAAAVAGQLRAAGIVVELPELPPASTPASILFAASLPAGDGGRESRPRGFSWLPARSSPDGAANDAPNDAAAAPAESGPVRPVQEAVAGPAGLPKRVPKGQLLAAPKRAVPPRRPGTARDPERARGFLSNFQSGVRQSEDRRGEAES